MKKIKLLSIIGFLSILILIVFYMTNNSSSKIKSKSFALVLKTLISQDVKVISVEDAYKSFENYVFLDAREPEEYKVSHIANAVFVGYKDFTSEQMNNIPKDKHIVVYCSIGKRSENIGTKLNKVGFNNVSNLYGGIFEWVNHGYPVYNSENSPTDKVHAYSKLWGRFVNKGTKVY
jgi:rhodanese-related sulfurtransferase